MLIRKHNFLGNSIWLILTIVIMQFPRFTDAQQKNESPKPSVEAEQAMEEALSALTLLHDNQLSKLYRDKISDLQKKTGLTTEAKAVSAFAPQAQITPGAPQERKLLFEQRTDRLPLFFQDLRSDFYTFVFLSKYHAGSFQEEVYMVKEKSMWKVAAIGIRKAL